jgi:hypothetical protein
MATITSTSTRITVSGTYKAIVGGSGSSTTIIQYASGNAPASGDAGRFLLWKVNTALTSTWEIRYIESATSTTITVGDGGFKSSPPSGASFTISTNLADIESAVTACTVSGKSYSFNGRDWLVTNSGFLADVDVSLDTQNQNDANSWQASNGCAVQFGRLTGGEANGSTITRQGCYISMDNAKPTANSNVFGNGVSEVANGPIFNFYGSYIKNYTSTAGNWAFMRGTGPVRMIGSIWDGPIGGAFYHSASELVDTKFRGNTNLTPAWSIRATFGRDVSNAQFANGLAAFKTFESYTGVFRNTVFDLNSLNTVVFLAGSTVGGATLIDCTTFTDADITDSGSGYVFQAKSVNYTLTDTGGTGLTGVKTAIYNVDGTIQGAIRTSSSGAVSEIVTVFNQYQDSAPSSNKAPFDIRIRKYGFVYLGFQSAVSEPIKQEVRLAVNSGLVSTEAQAAAITGISLNFATETVTITSNHNTQNLYDYYQYQLAQDAQMQYGEDLIRTGDSFNLDDWDMVVDGCTYTGDASTTGLITLINAGVFIGTRTDANGTVLPLRNIAVTGLAAGSRICVYNQNTATQVYNQIVAGTSYTAQYAEGVGYSIGDVLELKVAKIDKLEFSTSVVVTDAGWTSLVSQDTNLVYAEHGKDGSTVTGISWDSGNLEFDFNDSDNNINGADIGAWYYYFITTEIGIAEAFGALVWSQINKITNATNKVAITFDNVKSYPLQINNCWIDRDDGVSIISPTSNSIQIAPFAVFSISNADVASIKAKTDLLNFTGTDVKATLDGEQVVTDTASREASKATTTVASNMRGTDGANTVVPTNETLTVAQNTKLMSLDTEAAKNEIISDNQKYQEADEFITPTTFTKKKKGTNEVLIAKNYTTDGQGTETLIETS